MALRFNASFALILSSAFVLAIACGGSDSKTPAPSDGDAGDSDSPAPIAGRSSGGQGGAGKGGQSSAGKGGAMIHVGGAAGDAAGEGGSAGEPSTDAGAGGEGGEGGNGVVLSCEAYGNVEQISFDSEPVHQLCRNSFALLSLYSLTSDDRFQCCGTSDAGYGVTLAGLNAGEGGGYLGFVVPAEAPYTTQALTVACPTVGELNNTIAYEVTDTAPPVVTMATQHLSTQGNMTLTGSNLTDVDRVVAWPLDDLTYSYPIDCSIDPASQTATQLVCHFGYINPGQYQAIAFHEECGSAEPIIVIVDKPIE